MKSVRKFSGVLRSGWALAGLVQLVLACSSSTKNPEASAGSSGGSSGSDCGEECAGTRGGGSGSGGQGSGAGQAGAAGDGGAAAEGGSNSGGSSAGGSSAGGSSAGGSSAGGSSAGEGGDGGNERNCPEEPPSDGSACTGDTRRCGYDPEWLDTHRPICVNCACREVFGCDGKNWHLENNDDACNVPPNVACPEVLPDEQASCSTTGLVCRYGGKLCSCVPAELIAENQDPSCAPEPTWHCSEPRDPCPKLLPLGEACDVPGTDCLYEPLLCCGPFTEANTVGCADGVWSYNGGGECNPE